MAEDKARGKGDNEDKAKDPSRKKKRKKFIILFVILLFLFVLLTGVFIAIRTGMVSRFMDNLLSERIHSMQGDKEPDFLFEMEEIVVNIAGDRRQFLSIKFYVGYDEPKLTEELEKRKPEVRDAILRVLWEKTVKDVETIEGKEKLRLEILETINSVVRMGQVRGVYFAHIMIQ